MSQYMLLLYATEVEGDELAEREAEIPMFLELNRSLEEAGLLVAAISTVCHWNMILPQVSAQGLTDDRESVRATGLNRADLASSSAR